MQNSLPDLEALDVAYNLHVGAEPVQDYNITLIYPNWKPPQYIVPKVDLHPPEKIKANLAKLGIFF
jgi:hypothetical protein